MPERATMQGQTVSHYRIISELGRGGMGIVYVAEDTKLGRRAALKFLPPEASRDEEAKQRFIHEARAASALDHPNICTLFEIDESADGQLFIAMPCYEGETLRERLRRGPLATVEALDVASQAAHGLRKAHAAGIVHRDIKPANLFLTTDGVVKVLDFGLAKLTGLSGLTRTGTTLGTCAYMAPEQIRGVDVDARADLWALGVVLYEMLAGRPPFTGERETSLMHAVLHDTPRPIGELAPDAPARIGEILGRLLAKSPADRYGSATELAKDLDELRDVSSGRAVLVSQPPLAAMMRRPRFAVPAAVVALALVAAGIWGWERSAGARWARAEAIPEVARLVDAGEYAAAFGLAERAARYAADDPLLYSLNDHYAMAVSVTTEPAGADVYVQDYGARSDDWRHLGRTPLEARLARGALHWRFERDGFEPAERATTAEFALVPALQGRMDVTLVEAAAHAPGMVFVPAGAYQGFLNTMPLSADLPAFFLDRTEVTNRAFKEFVDAGGYATRTWWDGFEFIGADGAVLTLEQALARFTDTTGRPGPAGWELGAYPAGEDEHPVTGVSWYEAAAYARFRGMALPTVYHWAAAALPQTEGLSSLGALSVPLSNFGGERSSPVGQHRGVGPYGTLDMHGNVREWVRNHGPQGGWAVGGGWSDAPYDHRSAISTDLFARSEQTGLRLMREQDPEAAVASLGDPIDLLPATQRSFEPVSDEVFETLRSLYPYAPGALNPTGPVVVETTLDWVKERVTIDTGYGERMDVFLFVPTRREPPFQAIVFFTGALPFLVPTESADLQPGFPTDPFDWLIRSGRVLVQPIFQGSYERFQAPFSPWDETRSPREWVERRWELGRTIDYLATRPDIDADRLGYLGYSMGAGFALPLLALEPRFSTAVLIAGGVFNQPLPAMIEPVNYLPRITIPALIVGGRYDYVHTPDNFERPLFGPQRPVYDLLGTAEADKRHVILDAGHVSFPRAELARTVLDWLDEYLGPVQ